MDEAKIIDLIPRLRRRQQETCDHDNVTVSFKAAELSCDDCGKAVDPWWYIRKLCEYREELVAWRKRQEGAVDAKIDEGNRILARMNETITRLNGEISHLTDVKNRLFNERTPDGRLMGVASRRHRPRKK